MKHLLFAALSLAAGLLPATTRAQTTPAADWLVACGTNSQPLDLTVDAQHNTYVTGYFSGTITLGATTLSATQVPPGYNGAQDTFMAKLNEQGQYQWAMQFGDGQKSLATQLVPDQAGHLFMVGSFRSYSLRLGAGGPVLYNSSAEYEGFVACFSAQTGQCQWARRFGGTGVDYGNSLALSPTGEVYLTGQMGAGGASFGPTTLPGASNAQRAFLAKLDAAGTWRWARQLGGDGYLWARQLLCDAQGAVYLGGDFYSPSVTLGSTTLVTHQLTGWGNRDGHDVFVAKFNAAGTVRWAVQGDATGANNAQGGRLAADGQDHLYLAGWFNSRLLHLGGLTLTNASLQGPQPTPAPPVPYTENFYSDAFVARLDTAGAWQWATRRGGDYDEYARAVSLPANGQVMASFLTDYPTAYTLATLDPATGAGLADYTLPITSPSYYGYLHLASDNFGRLYVSDTFTGSSMTLGTQAIPGAGSTPTGYIARLGQQVLATHPTPPGASTGLHAWPSPGPGSGVWVQGAPAGQPVQVLDVLGRQVGTGTMPASGPLRLSWAGAGLAPGVYIIRAGQLGTRWVVED